MVSQYRNWNLTKNCKAQTRLDHSFTKLVTARVTLPTSGSCHGDCSVYWGVKVKAAQLWPHGTYIVHGTLQARILELVAFPFSRGSSRPRDQTQVSCTAGRFFTSWATREAQEYWSGWLIPSPGDLSNPGVEPVSPALQADSLPAELHSEHRSVVTLSGVQ